MAAGDVSVFSRVYRDHHQQFFLPQRLLNKPEQAIELVVGNSPTSVMTISLTSQGVIYDLSRFLTKHFESYRHGIS